MKYNFKSNSNAKVLRVTRVWKSKRIREKLQIVEVLWRIILYYY